jgi:WG containing repeat
MKTILIIGLLLLVIAGLLFAFTSRKSKKYDFSSIINDPRVNTKEVGLREGIEYFQVIENDKYGFRDLDGNIVIKPQFDNAEMFSEGYSAVTVAGKWGLIDTKGNYIIKPKYDFLEGVHEGLCSFDQNGKIGFINTKDEIIIKPHFFWVDQFSEGLCAVSTDFRSKEPRKYGYIDTTGKIIIDFKFEYAYKFEKGKAKVQLDGQWLTIDKTGNISG